MISFPFLRRAARKATIDRLHGKIVAAARRPPLYLLYGVPDTFEGRFDMLVFHAALMLGPLADVPDGGPALAQDITDTIFLHLDRTLREMGVGDMSVPKRMKTLVQAYLGRGTAYEKALQSNSFEMLAQALRRNVYGGDALAPAQALAHYASAARAALRQAAPERYLGGEVELLALPPSLPHA